jgi:fluoride ion exporter CrcB/FEX
MEKDTSHSTILVISTGFLILYFVFSWHWAIVVSLILGVAGALSTFMSKKIEWVWMKLSQLLGYIVPNILLSIVFYLFLFPISVLSKLFTKDPLMLSKKYESYFVDIHKDADKESFEKIW